MYIVALNGSHNDDGNTAFLLKEILGHCAEKGAETEIISIHKAIKSAKSPFCVSCSSPCSKACYESTLLEEAFQKVTRADFVIFGSPVYFGSMTAQMKAFFDKTRAIRADKAWVGKPMATVTVGASKYGGQERTAEAMQSCALVNGMTVVGNSSGVTAGHFGVSAERPAQNDEFARNACKALAERILEIV